MKSLLDPFLRFTRLSEFPVTVRGGINRGLRWTLYPWSSYWRGTHEPALQQVLDQLGDLTGKTCWDLGAHFGFYSLAFASRVGPTGQVAAFEPSADAFAKLQRHQRLNRFKHLSLFPAAVSSEEGQAELLNSEDRAGTTSHLAYAHEDTSQATRRSVIRTVSLDNLVATGEIRLPDIVKIDVEGHGGSALQGAINSICESRPIILMGLHCPEEINAVEELLFPLGYTAADEAGRPRTELNTLGDIVLRPDQGPA